MNSNHTAKPADEESNVLQYVKTFRSLAQSIRENLDSLLVQKRQQDQQSSKQQHSEIIDKSFQTLINLRTNHRSLYLEVEKNRLHTQKEKEKIDVVASELEELNYLRDSIFSEINISKNRTFSQLSQLEVLSAKVKANDINLTPQNIRDSHDELLGNFNVELESRKKAKLEYEKKEEDKNVLIKKCEEDKNFLTKIPQHIQKITESCKPLQHLYKTGVSSNFDQVQFSRELPPQLYRLYKKLTSLKETKTDESVEIEITKSTVNPILSEYQIIFSLLKDKLDPSLKRYSDILGEKSFFSGAYPLKFCFSFCTTHNLVLVSLDKATKHSSNIDELLSYLIQDDSGSKLYSNPTDTAKKEFNAKYTLFKWVQNLCEEGKTINFVESEEPEHSSRIATLIEIVKAIRRRIVHRLLLKYQFDSLRNNRQIPVNVLKLFDMNESPKLSIEILACNKISREDYIRNIDVPVILKEKEDISNKLLSERTLSQKIQTFFDKKKNHSNSQLYRYGTRDAAYSKQTSLSPERSGRGDTEEFYRIEFSHPKYSITAYIIINYDYPNTIIADTAKEMKLPTSVQQKCNHKTLQQIKNERSAIVHKISPSLYNVIEKTLNQKVNLPDPAFNFAYKILLLMITIQKQLD